ncbi:hypothetical protein P43SY_003816 [Pythium insidiosum]|uniref:Uncharacterized protein n=1 Tax=Pythium insidiosum TaxID=114742 RepID=A0AAD5Q331_PYTIN|nr:hypothetical protein P43SY_003816 [Pythium insidiosum]
MQAVQFEAAPPAFVFVDQFFHATVKLVDQHKVKTPGHARPLQVTLRFHDTYDVVADQSIMLVDPNATVVDSATGTCQLRVALQQLTAACDGRAFCLEVRSVDGDLESAFSSPVQVVKEKLRIVQQPPDVWFKDEGGREKCMVVMAVLESAPDVPLEQRVVPLQLRLLYESGATVANQSILRLFPDMRPNMTRGRVTISFRIDDVSKNHQGQSFVLEIAPEKQENSQMFQDIAPVRTSVIAIRSKRNKRKLNGLTPRNGSVSGTPRAGVPGVMMPMMAMTPTPATSPMAAGGGGGGLAPPAQRPRHLRMMPTTPGNNQYVVTPHPASRIGHGVVMMAPTTWSSHIQPQHSAQHTPSHTPMATPASTPMAGTPMAAAPPQVEWKLAGFEIHGDGTSNVSRPIYRCTHCRRLVDVEMMNQGQDLHAAQCVFANNMGMYRSQVEGASAMAIAQQAAAQHYYATSSTPRAAYAHTTPRATVPTPVASTSSLADPMGMSYSMTPSQDMSMAMASTTDASSVVTTAMSMAGDSSVANDSPKSLGNQVSSSSSHRPVLTISPYMNKVVTGEALSDNQQLGADQNSPNDPSDTASGNLFASNAFRSQMGLTDISASPTTEEKLAYLSKPLDEDKPETNQLGPEYSGDNPQGSTEDQTSASLIVSVGNNAFYNEMTSMGINMTESCFSKSNASPSMLDPGHPMSDFDGFADPTAGDVAGEDQVFYILARMYTSPQLGKLGLPAFDQFQRMLGFYTESQQDAQTQVLFHSVRDVGLSDKEQSEITNCFVRELQQSSEAVHSLPKYQHNVVLLREDALMYYWSQSIQSLT